MKYETPILISRTSGGENKFWQGVAEQRGNAVVTYSRSWHITSTGKTSSVVESVPVKVNGKNLGKKNETTPWDQAVAEIKSDYALKQKKGYWPESETEPPKRPLPMLAQKWAERSKHIVFPAYVQPKLDGIRMLFDGREGWTREGNDVIPEVIEHLRFNPGIILDGELILPPPYTFQDTIRAKAKFRPELSPLLEYHVYDVVDTTLPYSQRLFQVLHALHAASIGAPKNVKTVGTFVVESVDDVARQHAGFVEWGYEGTMVRNRGGFYKVKDRSNDLLKYKDFLDAEYVITDVVDGKGREEGCAIFTCQTPRGRYFEVRPKGTIEQRTEMFNRREEIIGKRLTVQYQNLTDDGVPRFPVGVAVRDYE